MSKEQFHVKMQNEAYVDNVESVLQDIREYLISGVLDSLSGAEYETASDDAQLLASCLEVEVFVLNETPTFA